MHSSRSHNFIIMMSSALLVSTCLLSLIVKECNCRSLSEKETVDKPSFEESKTFEKLFKEIATIDKLLLLKEQEIEDKHSIKEKETEDKSSVRESKTVVKTAPVKGKKKYILENCAPVHCNDACTYEQQCMEQIVFGDILVCECVPNYLVGIPVVVDLSNNQF